MLLVQEFLKTKTFYDLEKDHAVYARFCNNLRLFTLNYDQIEVRDSDLLSQQCRGLILSKLDNSTIANLSFKNDKDYIKSICPGETKIISYPMNRFFNVGQVCAADINFSDPNTVVMEKLDGTMISVYYDEFSNKWNRSTRSVPEADLVMDTNNYTFGTLFDKALKDTLGVEFNEFVKKLDKDHVYCFELTTPLNRIVVFYNHYKITLLAVRNKKTLQEINFDNDIIKNINVPLVKLYPLNNLSSLVEWVSTLDPMSNEGIVVRDSDFNRIKIKNAAYVAYSKVKDKLGSSKRNCMKFILLEKDDDVAQFLPQEIVDDMFKLKANLNKLIVKYDDFYQECKKVAFDKKAFALLINSSKDYWTAPLFSIYNNKSLSMKDFILSSKKEGTWSDAFLDKLLELCI